MTRVQQTGPSDGDLVTRARDGSADAFGELVTRYQDRVYNACYRMCHDHADAADLTQVTFLKALDSLGHFEGRASFYTWLFRIAMNLAISQRRRQHRRRMQSVEALTPDGEAPRELAVARGVDPARALEACEERERVSAALAALDEDFRAAIVLKDIEGLDYAAIAEILDVPIGTVKSRIHRGRLMLKEMLTFERTRVAPR
jgi:RNA polymerase sigma-70 factor (ECF subfamily)